MQIWENILQKASQLEPVRIMINAVGGVVRSYDSPTMMCRAEVTGSLVPTVAKQVQSVEPDTNRVDVKIQRIRSQEQSNLETAVLMSALTIGTGRTWSAFPE